YVCVGREAKAGSFTSPIEAEAGELLVTALAFGGLELIDLRVAFRCELASISLAVEVGAWTVVERGVDINPDHGIGVACVHRSCGGFRQVECHQHFFKQTVC